MKKIFILSQLFLLSLVWCDIPEGITARSAVLMDFDTGRILAEREGDLQIPPASMMKVMTLYLAYDAIKAGELDKDQLVTIDEAGSSFSRPPRSSLMLLEEGQVVTVQGLMEGLAIASGNDAAYALAELIGPGTDAFVEKMNRKAAELGLEQTVFVDPDGWSENNLVTAEEYAVLARSYIRDYPEALTELHSVPFLVYPLPVNMPEDRTFRIQVPRKKQNTNRLLGTYEGIDGLKTGYIDESGFNFSATAVREGNRLISVIMGVFTDSYFQGIVRRADESAMLLDYGFANYRNRELSVPVLPEIRVWMGSESSLVPAVQEGGEALLGEDEINGVYSMVHLDKEITAPLTADRKIGTVSFYLQGCLLEEVSITAGKDIPRGNIIQQLRDHLILAWRDFRVKYQF